MGCGSSVAAGGPDGKNYRPLAPMRTMDVQTDKVYISDIPFDEEKEDDEMEANDGTALVKNNTSKRKKKAGHDPNNIEDLWFAVCQTLDVPKGEKSKNKELVVRRSGWKTIRIFVSSTFKDFHQEREILVKEVFPDLRAWCEARRLHLVECDLRWGVPKDSTTESTLRTCLGEIDRCYADNVMPYFLNMTSQRVGWIPSKDDVPQTLVDEYKWIFGLSMTEMEIMHGAYRKDNPNSLFLIRDDSFMSTIPEEHQRDFIDENPIATQKLKMLKEQIIDRFPVERVMKYSSKFGDVDLQTQKIHLHVDEVFKIKIFDFFKERIGQQYPLDETTVDVYQHMKESHDAFMKSRAESVLGRQDILDEIYNYVCGKGHDVPLMVLGGPGSGKSSILAKIVDVTEGKALGKEIPNGGDKGWHVFYHFVGAVPGSTELEPMLKRLLKEMKIITDTTMPADLSEACQITCGALSNIQTRPTIIFVDAVNQFSQSGSMLWIPRKLPPNIRLILSMIPDTEEHKLLMSRESKPDSLEVSPLDLKARMIIVRDVLGRYNKSLDLDQMVSVLAKESSANPLWLSIACEELRVFGDFYRVTEKVSSLRDGLLELLEDVLSRFEEENGGYLLVATLCLLEASQNGLLESELLSLLADDDLMPSTDLEEKGVKEEAEKQKKLIGSEKLPAFQWAMVFRALRPFLRPYGDSGEGRLDFYHRSLSKAVRRKYFKMNPEGPKSELSKQLYKWWHRKLADYFEVLEQLDRRLEEYPHHLIALEDQNRMITFLCEEYTMETLYDEEYSGQLFKLWRDGGGGLKRMEERYKNLALLWEFNFSKDQLGLKYQKLSRLFVEAGCLEAAETFAKRCYDLETMELGNRPERLVEIYTLLTKVQVELNKIAFPYISKEMLPSEAIALGYARKAYAIRVTMTGDENQLKLAKLMMQVAGPLNHYIHLSSEELSSEDALEESRMYMSQAVEIFTKFKDNCHLAEAFMCIALQNRAANLPDCLKYYNKALELSLQSYGEYSTLTGRLYTNLGIYYEDNRDFEKAFDHFYKCYQIRRITFGEEHPKTKKIMAILTDQYKAIANLKGITLLTD